MNASVLDDYLPFLNGIDERIPTILAELKEWVEINTFSSNIAGLNLFSSRLFHAFECVGGQREFLALPPVQSLGLDGKISDRAQAYALKMTKRPESHLKIFFGGHLDTVFPPEGPFQKVIEKERAVWNGPGIADMKGGIAILLLALEAFERSPWAEKVGWEVLLTPDEEIGSPSSSKLYISAAERCDLGLIFEPSFPDGAFVSARKGSANYTVVVRGRSAHVGRDFSTGRSAVFPLARLIEKLGRLLDQGDLTVNVAELEGKSPVNVVPPLAGCRINFRSFSTDILEEASAYLYQTAKEISSLQEGIHFEISQDSMRGAKPFDEKCRELFSHYASCARQLNLPFQVRETGGVCDGNYLASAGLPVLDTAGAVGGSMHTVDEYIILTSIAQRAKLAALFLLKWAAGEIVLKKGESRRG